MDPLSFTASIAAVLQLTGTVLSYLNDVNNASKDRAKIAIEASIVYSLFTALKYRLEEADPTDPWYRGVRSLGVDDGPLDQFKTALELLASKLAPGNNFKKFGRTLMWTFTKQEVADILSKIERLKTLVNLALANDLFTLSKAIKDEVSVLRNRLQEAQLERNHEQRQSIAGWLTQLDFKSRQHAVFSRRQQGTGEWLLESTEFQRWIEIPGKTLWCPGIPGAGKTIFASIVVDYLQTRFKSDDVATVCIYCNYKEKKEQDAQSLVASMLKQLVQDCKVVSEDMKTQFKPNLKREGSLPPEDLTRVLHIEITRRNRVFLVVDALDECTEESGIRAELLDELKSLPENVNLLVTSRRISAIMHEFEGAESLEIYANDKDTTKYILGRIQREHRLARHVKADPGLDQVIVNGVISKAHGMFLLVRLHMDSLVNKNNRRAIDTALKQLPREIDDTYREALKRIQEQNQDDRELANKVLMWITFAFTPLSILELQHALAVEDGSPETHLDALPDEEIIISVCAGLVIIDESDTVRLVHYTLEEYLDRTRDDRYPNAHDDVLATCITYLSYCDICSGPCKGFNELESRLLQNPFLDYVACYWGYHAFESTNPDMQDALFNFLMDQSAVSSCSQVTFLDLSDADTMTGMHLAAYFGLPASIRRLLENGVAADSSGLLRRTPLSMAAQRGFSVTVGLLLEREDVDMNSQDPSGLTPLHYAAMSGSSSVAKLLIAKGVTVDKCNNRGQTSLHLAAENGHEDTVQVLIEAGSDVNARSDTNATPLFRAARRGHASVIRRLLAAKADVNLITHDGYSPLRTAVGYSQVDAVEVLLTARPSLDLVDVNGWIPLEVAWRLRNSNIIVMLENAAAKKEEPSLKAA